MNEPAPPPETHGASGPEAPTFPAKELAEASALLRELLRIDTSNPPGNERPAAELLGRRLADLGLEPVFAGRDPERPNLVATWRADPSRRTARPLVLSCHLDTVPADPERWTHPPFSGHYDGEQIWGRGAIDMKGFAVMAFAALARLRREGIALDRDLVFAAVCDEEAGTRLGSDWLVRERPELLGGDPEYVINEVGGFTVHLQGRRYYPVQVAEKGVAWLRLTVDGVPGHSSLPAPASAVAALARAIATIDSTRLPWHPSEEARRYLDGFAAPRGPLARRVASLLALPGLGPRLLPLLVPEPSRRAVLEALLRNTATPTALRSSNPINVLPASVSVDIDGRLAPGQTAADLVAELERIAQPACQGRARFTILHESPPVAFSLETPLYRAIAAALEDADPGCHVVPSLIPGFTDSRNYARLGAQCYGFYPLRLPPDLDFAALFHGHDERIPEAGFHWGIRTLANLLRKFLSATPE